MRVVKAKLKVVKEFEGGEGKIEGGEVEIEGSEAKMEASERI